MKTKTLLDNINGVDECLTHILIELNGTQPYSTYDTFEKLREDFRRVANETLRSK